MKREYTRYKKDFDASDSILSLQLVETRCERRLHGSHHSSCQCTQEDRKATSASTDGVGGTVENTAGKSTGSLNSTLHEARSASVHNGLVEIGLVCQNQRLVQAGSIRSVRLPADERGEGKADARSAKLVFGGVLVEEEEDDVVGKECVGVWG